MSLTSQQIKSIKCFFYLDEQKKYTDKYDKNINTDYFFLNKKTDEYINLLEVYRGIKHRRYELTLSGVNTNKDNKVQINLPNYTFNKSIEYIYGWNPLYGFVINSQDMTDMTILDYKFNVLTSDDKIFFILSEEGDLTEKKVSISSDDNLPPILKEVGPKVEVISYDYYMLLSCWGLNTSKFTITINADNITNLDFHKHLEEHPVAAIKVGSNIFEDIPEEKEAAFIIINQEVATSLSYILAKHKIYLDVQTVYNENKQKIVYIISKKINCAYWNFYGGLFY